MIDNLQFITSYIKGLIKNILTDLIRSSWKMTGFNKFEHFGEVSDPKVSSKDIQNELNEQLELFRVR